MFHINTRSQALRILELTAELAEARDTIADLNGFDIDALRNDLIDAKREIQRLNAELAPARRERLSKAMNG